MRDALDHLTAEQEPHVRCWPEPPAAAAFHGLAGRWTQALEPHTEADPVAILVQFLVCFGNVIGRTAHFRVEADQHFTNLFAALVGTTAKGRKGTSWGQTKALFGALDPDWLRHRTADGLSSGEGLIWAVRDAIEKKDGLDDGGVTDKRLLCVESEFAMVLRAISREGNTLSPVVRNAWDTGDLRTLTKNSPAKATGAHISLLAHITSEELLRYLKNTESANGFGNRFLWLAVRRSKQLPHGGQANGIDRASFLRELRLAVNHAQQVGELRMDHAARGTWERVYPGLSEGKPGLLGAMTGRAEPQVLRLATLYALLDCSASIGHAHLNAALAVWNYCDASAAYIFGDSLGDGDADELLRALRSTPGGLTRTEIRDHFGRHKSALQIARALTSLDASGMASRAVESTAGRPTERWFAGKPTSDQSDQSDQSQERGDLPSLMSLMSHPPRFDPSDPGPEEPTDPMVYREPGCDDDGDYRELAS